MISPTRVPLPTPASTNVAARSLSWSPVRRSRSGRSGRSPSACRDRRWPGAAPARRWSHGRSGIEQPPQPTRVDLAAGEQRDVGGGRRRRYARDLVRRQLGRERGAQRRFVESVASFATITAATTSPRSGSGSPITCATAPPVTAAMTFSDLCGRHVGARGLDHRAAPAEEVDEPVARPGTPDRRWRTSRRCRSSPRGCGGGSAASERSPDAGVRRARRPDGIPVSGSTTSISNPGAGLPNEPRRCLGLIGFVAADKQGAARFGHAQHVVPQFGIPGRTSAA